MRRITEIIIHCTATRPEWWATKTLQSKIAEVRRWHVSDRGWKDIGYHYLIDRNGKVGEGRPLEQTGAHVQGRNTGTIGIALFGGHGSAETDAFADNFTADQEQALRALIAGLQLRFGPVPVTGHNQFSAKACPGFNAPQWFARKPDTAHRAVSAPPVASRPVATSPAPQTNINGHLAAFLALLARIFGGRK